jgi:hypothetical protein
MARSTAELREAWQDWQCRADGMMVIDFGPDRIRVAPVTKDAWAALAQVMAAHGYKIRPSDTDSYNCRQITGGTEKSLHAYGIALDVNWQSNPYRKTPNRRPVRFSLQPTQEERAFDVKADLADTDMTPAMIADIMAIKTVEGRTVFTWGGAWQSVKDAMHFQLDLTPDEMSRGIAWDTVVGADGSRVASGGDGIDLLSVEDDPELTSDDIFAAPVRVSARGLNMRLGPTVAHPRVGELQSGQVLDVVASARDAEGNEWLAVKVWVASRYRGEQLVEPV